MRTGGKAVILLGIATICAGGIIAFWRTKHVPSDLEWAEKITGIRFPKDASDIMTASAFEFCFSVRMILAPETADSFVKQLGLAPGAAYGDNARYGVDGTIFQDHAKAQRLLGLNGHSQWNTWNVEYDPSTRRIWIVVMTPDYGGDPPSGSDEATKRELERDRQPPS